MDDERAKMMMKKWKRDEMDDERAKMVMKNVKGWNGW